MNVIWSKYVQGVNTLYDTRKLRFHDMFAEQYKALFDLDANHPFKSSKLVAAPERLQELYIAGIRMLK